MTYLSFTALSKLIAVIATYPYRLMRTRMQDQHHEHNGAIDILIRTWRFVLEKRYFACPKHVTRILDLMIYLLFLNHLNLDMKVSEDSTKGCYPHCYE